MKNKNTISLFFSALIFSVAVIAQQPCSEDQILNKKGTWKKETDYLKTGIQSEIFRRIDKMQNVLQAAYPEPKGTEAKWYPGVDNYPLINNGPIPYQMTALFLHYFCNSNNANQLELGGETATWFYVFANQFNWFLDLNKNWTVKGNPVYLLRKKVGELNSYPLYEGIYNGTSNTGTRYSRTMIITRPGQSPYIPVTRWAYLQLFLKRYEKKKSNEISFEEKRPVRSESEEEANRQRGLKNIEKTTSAAYVEREKIRYLKTYETEKENREKSMKKMLKRYEDEMKPAQDLLKNMSKEEAWMPAIVWETYFYEFKKFFTEKEGGRMLVWLNPDYFDSKLPKYVPQFLVVYWSWSVNKPSENFKNQLEANLDFKALKEMIDK